MVLLISFSTVLFSQETFGQLEDRICLLDKRFFELYNVVFKTGYRQTVGDYFYVDSIAKLSAYAWYISQNLDTIYQHFSYSRSREWGRNTIKHSDSLMKNYNHWFEWGMDLTGRRQSDNKPFADIFLENIDIYVRLLINGATRL